MKKIDRNFPLTFLADGWSEEPVSNQQIRQDRGFTVKSFTELVSRIAQLAFYNKDHVLLYRGQCREHHKASDGRKLTVLKPSIFRAVLGEPLLFAIPQRYERLARAEKLLTDKWLKANIEGGEDIARHRILRWAILQHYEVCKTPLLDATHSLRVAVSFASLNAKHKFAILYVLGVPQLSGAVTASAEAGVQTVRLSSICPPSARRPHFQEGYLVGEYPEIQTVEEKDNYASYENDFCRRLLAKFRLELKGFREDPVFPLLPEKALFPDMDDNDPLESVIRRIKLDLGDENIRLSKEG